jgi:hypothetical protein
MRDKCDLAVLEPQVDYLKKRGHLKQLDEFEEF